MIWNHQPCFVFPMLFILLSSVGNFVEAAGIEAESTTEMMQKKYCFMMKKRYNILPGKSFGALPVAAHATYLHARCHRFFCEPHPMAGTYSPPPLPPTIMMLTMFELTTDCCHVLRDPSSPSFGCCDAHP